MRVMDLIMDILKREGVSKFFCYPTTPLIDAAAAAGIKPYLCRQERTGIHMADGYARVTNGGSPAVFAMQYGPGAENGFPGVTTSYSDSSPILFLPLGHPRDRAQLYPMFKSTRSFASVTKSVEDIFLPEQTRNVMRRAFSALRNGRHGPVMVEVPIDVTEMEAGSADDYQPIPATICAPHYRDVEAAARRLLDAKCPMILAGQGVLYADATPELVQLADLLQIPVMTTIEGKSGFPENHPLALGSSGNVSTGQGYLMLNRADLVFGIGCSFTVHNIVSPKIKPNQKVIHATNDVRDLHKAYETDVSLLGDAKLTLQMLIEAVRDLIPKGSVRPSIAPQLNEAREKWLAYWNAKLISRETPMTPYRVMAEFIKAVNPDSAIVTHDSGSPRDQLMPFYVATVPRSYIGWGKSHALGSGLGLTIGAKLAKPEKFCVNFMGDAAFGMTGLDFETAVRCDAPILTVVLNNSSMAVETESLKLSHNLFHTRDIGGNYANIAKDLGGWSERVEDPEQIRDAFLRARRKTEEGRPALLEFITNEETSFSHRHGAAH